MYYPAGDGAADVALGDFNGDDVLDLAVADAQADGVSILLGIPGGAAVGEPPDAPLGPRIVSVTPNPISARATIDLELRAPARAQLRVTDATGRQVECLLDQEVATGATRVVWDISRDAAERIPGGVYFLSLSTGARESVRRIAVLR